MKIKQNAVIVLLTFTAMFSTTSRSYSQDTQKEKAVKTYYNGFEKKDWSTIESQLADGFTFTSPAPDNDHISLERFKNDCWPTSKMFKSVSFLKMFEKGDGVSTAGSNHYHGQQNRPECQTFNKFNSGGKNKGRLKYFLAPGVSFSGNTK